MDCLTFRKLISSYMKKELPDEELNDFLCHMKSCKECREELEINYIVEEGVRILDEEKGDYNILAAFQKNVQSGDSYISKRKRFLSFIYCLDTVVFWAVVFSAVIALRMIFFE